MKVAVCLSGEPRTISYCYKSILDFFPNADFFCHAWNSNRVFYDEEYQITLPQGLSKKSKIDDIKNTLKQSFSPKKIIVEQKSKELFVYHNLFESFYKSVALKQEYEEENNFKYDIVVKCRYDLVFDVNYTFKPDVIFPRHLYTTFCTVFQNEHKRIGFSDVIFYSDSKTMDLCSNIFLYLLHLKHSFSGIDYDATFPFFNKNSKHYYHTAESSKSFGPGTLLWDYFTRYNLYGNKSKTYLPDNIVRPSATVFDYRSQNEMQKIRAVYEKGFRNNSEEYIIIDLDSNYSKEEILNLKNHGKKICGISKNPEQYTSYKELDFVLKVTNENLKKGNIFYEAYAQWNLENNQHCSVIMSKDKRVCDAGTMTPSLIKKQFII